MPLQLSVRAISKGLDGLMVGPRKWQLTLVVGRIYRSTGTDLESRHLMR